MRRCPFCDAVAGKSSTPELWRNDQVCCILDLNPINPGHALVISAVHEPSFTALPDAALAAMMSAGRMIATALKASELPCDGIDLILTDGKAAGQSVPHCHLHVIPRVEGDGFRFSHGRHSAHTNLDEAAGRIRAAMDRLPMDESASGGG
jgi:histidine triad (HIT) family protein